MEYNSSISDVNEVTKKVSITVPKQQVEVEVDSELARLQRTAMIKGFRPGKAPKQMLERLHGGRVRMEVASRLMQETLGKVIESESLDIIGNPEIDSTEWDTDGNFQFTAQVFLFPTPTITDFKGISVDVEKPVVEDELVDRAIQEYRKSQSTLKAVEGRDVVQKGDVIEGKLTVSIGEDQPEGSEEPLVVSVGEGHLPDELESGLIGIKVGESKVIEGVIPEDHKDKSLRGQKARYGIMLEKISEQILPELTDEFAKGVGLQVETLLELRLKIRERLEERLQSEVESNTQAKILDAILEKNSFQVPQILIDDEIRGLLVRQGLVDPKKINVRDLPVENFRDGLGQIAERRVKTAVIVDRIAEQESISVSKEELEETLQKIAEDNGVPLDEVRKFFLDGGRAAEFTLEQTRSKVLKFLIEESKVNYIAPKSDEEDSKESKKAKSKNKKSADEKKSE